jgi:hypothetical protein
MHGMHDSHRMQKPHRRTISWSEQVDQIASDLAHQYKLPRGVSELLERLVIAEQNRKTHHALRVTPITKTQRSRRRAAA